MIERIYLAIVGESGAIVPIEKTSQTKIESKIETAIADLFSEICRRNNEIADEEIKIAEKFLFANRLKEYLEEMKSDAYKS